MYSLFLKRMCDIIFSLILLIVLSPVLIVVAILVRLKLGSPILFKQPRPGLHENIFNLYKFRTMTNERDEQGNLLPDDVRLTSFGKFLRSTSLDELPELFNILKGDMSFVGPRPLLVKYLDLYDSFQKQRHLVRPGLTGLAQVNGRNSVSWQERFKHDVHYVSNLSFIMDMKVIFKTIKVVFLKDGITDGVTMTMEEFKGNHGK